MKKASITEINSATVITMESWRVICASARETKNQGAKAMIVVSTAKITGLDTDQAPSIALSGPPPPALWLCW